MTTTLKESIIINTEWILAIGGGASAILAFVKLITQLSTVVIKISKQTDAVSTMQLSVKEQASSVQSMQTSVEEVRAQVMGTQKHREDNIKKLDQHDRDIRNLERSTDERLGKLTDSIKDIRDDLIEIKDMVKETTKKGDE